MDYWSLPGADAFLDSIRARVLEEQENVIVGLPENAAPDMAEALKTKLDATSARDVRHYASDGRALDVILYEAAGVPPSAPVAELMQHMCESRPVMIDAISPDTAPSSLLFLQEYANASRNLERFNPLVVIAIGLPWQDLPKAPKLTTIAWDDWIGEADVLVFIMHRWRHRFDHRSMLYARIICNLALWDIALAERLMALAESNWQHLFDPDQILACLADMEAEDGMQCNWESGGEAKFDGQTHRHLNTFAHTDKLRSELIQRLWAAQAAHLLPILEKRRRALVLEIKATGRLNISDLDEIELGSLVPLAEKHKLNKSLVNKAKKLRHWRNRLAHLEPLDASDTERLIGSN